ncbi:MAG: hypothetical protein H7336_14670 [Bacteriovorax sp.]|nr:hypothetical protein [Bacteriovorax sp.]
MNDGKVTVALLLSDLNEVKEISSVFKKLGIIPHFYEDLKTFWSGTLERLPALCIVDVKKMSEGSLILRDHPAVQAEEMPLLFYYTDKTEPLLVSTHQFYHMGVLKQSVHYEGPLKAILKRLNKVSALEQHYLSQKMVTIAQKEQIDRLELTLREEKQADNYQSMVKSVCLELEKYRLETDFFRALEKVFHGVDEIDEFAYLELSFNGQKLISPISHVQKFRNIPSLWLGQACTHGIELFAQNMATTVAVDIMGGDLVSLLIKGTELKPDKIIFIKSKNEIFFNNFDWNMLEAYLNGFYATFANKLSSPVETGKKLSSTFEAMSFLDQYLFGQTANEALANKNYQDLRLVDLDLTSLLQVILKKGSNRFFWNRFAVEFINKLEIQSRIDFKFFDFGVANIGFLVRASDLDVFFDQLKEFSNRFQYWKYFEDSEGVLSQLIQPRVTMSPMSAHAYLTKTLKAESELKEKIQEPKRAWNFIEPKTSLDM